MATSPSEIYLHFFEPVRFSANIDLKLHNSNNPPSHKKGCPFRYSTGSMPCHTVIILDISFYFLVRKCTNQATDANMLRTCSKANNYNSTCSYTCRRNRGLYMTRANDTVAIESGTLESTCTVSDTDLMSWTEDLPKCIVKSCPARR